MTTELIYNLLKYVALPLAAGYYIWSFYVQPNYRGWKNRRQPTITTSATVIGREKNGDNVIYSSYYTRDGGDVCMVIFRTENGQEVKLTVPRQLYHTLVDGSTGTLTYQGTKCERFEVMRPADLPADGL